MKINLLVVVIIILKAIFLKPTSFAMGGQKKNLDTPLKELWTGEFTSTYFNTDFCPTNIQINLIETETENPRCPLNKNYTIYGGNNAYEFIYSPNINCGLIINNGNFPFGKKMVFEHTLFNTENGQSLISKSGYKKFGAITWETTITYNITDDGLLHFFIKNSDGSTNKCEYKK